MTALGSLEYNRAVNEALREAMREAMREALRAGVDDYATDEDDAPPPTQTALLPARTIPWSLRRWVHPTSTKRHRHLKKKHKKKELPDEYDTDDTFELCE
jgi:hypothetical protein